MMSYAIASPGDSRWRGRGPITALVRAVSALLLVCFSTIAAPASAQPAEVVAVDRWSFWGTTSHFARDDLVPGKNALRLAAPAETGEHWSSGAGLPIPLALKAGEPVSATFWARAERPATVVATIQGDAPSYASFVNTTLDLTPEWKRYTVTGAAPSDFPAGTQSLTLMLGKVQAEVSLGPVLFAPGKPVEAGIEAAFAGYRPAWAAEDVRIASAPGVVLAGTLRTPAGPGPFPTVLLLGGSGPGVRGGTSPLMERLLADGMAVLEYDKRGVGRSTGEFVDSLRNMETDAAAAVRYLRNRSDMDASRIALIGHSQGGAVAPALAARDPAIAAVVMLAGPVRPVKPGKVNLIIMKDMLAKAGAAPAAIQQVAEASDRLFEAEARKAPPSEIAPLQEAVIQGFIACKFTRPQAEGALATLNSIVVEAWNTNFDQTLARLRAPVLALYASEDEHVSTPDNLPAAKTALAANPDAKVVEIADVNHGFHRVKNLRDHQSGTMVPEVIDMVADWLITRLQSTKAVTAGLN